MPEMVGADPDELEALGHRMESAGGRLDVIRTEIGSLLDHTHWNGFDADQFRGQWQHQLSGMLHTAATVTRDRGTTLRTNAHQQRDASEAGGGSGMAHGPLSSGAAPEPRSLADIFFTATGVGFPFIQARLLRNDVLKYMTSNKFKSDVARTLAGGVQKADKAIGDFVESGKALRLAGDAAGWVDKVADPFNFVAMSTDAARLSYEYQKDPHSAETLNAKIDVGFDAAQATFAGLAAATSETVAGPIVFGALDIVAKGGQLLFDVGTLVDPNLVKDVGDGIGAAAREFAHVAGSVANGAEKAATGVAHAADAVGSAVTGGVRSLLGKVGL